MKIQMTITFVLVILAHITNILFSQSAGNALRFDGSNDYVKTNSTFALPTSSGTFEGWIWVAPGETNNSFTFDFKENEKLFYYHQLIERGLDDCLGGTAQPKITLDSISTVKLFRPSDELVEKFNDFSKPIYSQICSL